MLVAPDLARRLAVNGKARANFKSIVLALKANRQRLRINEIHLRAWPFLSAAP